MTTITIPYEFDAAKFAFALPEERQGTFGYQLVGIYPDSFAKGLFVRGDRMPLADILVENFRQSGIELVRVPSLTGPADLPYLIPSDKINMVGDVLQGEPRTFIIFKPSHGIESTASIDEILNQIEPRRRAKIEVRQKPVAEAATARA